MEKYVICYVVDDSQDLHAVCSIFILEPPRAGLRIFSILPSGSHPNRCRPGSPLMQDKLPAINSITINIEI